MVTKSFFTKDLYENIAKGCGFLAASLSVASLVSMLTDSTSREMIFGDGVQVSGIMLVSFLLEIVAIVCGLAAITFTTVKKNKNYATGSNFFGMIASGLTLVYFAEKDTEDKSLPFKWGHGTSIASSVVFLCGALASKM